MEKAKALWATLSLPEPENQARPDTLEQLLVLLTRESARRIVHLVNGTAALAARTPRRLGHLLIRLSHQLLAVADASLQVTSTSLIWLKSTNLFYVTQSISRERDIFYTVEIIETRFLSTTYADQVKNSDVLLGLKKVSPCVIKERNRNNEIIFILLQYLCLKDSLTCLNKSFYVAFIINISILLSTLFCR